MFFLEKQCYSHLLQADGKNSFRRRFEMLVKNKQQGIGIPEVLIVLFIIAIIVVLALPQIMSSRRLFRFSGVQRQVVTSLREARQHAIGQRTPITFRYDDVDKRIIIFGGTLGAAGDAKNQVFQLTGDGIAPNELVYGRPAGATTAALGDGTNLSALTSNALEITFQTDGSVIDGSNNPLNRALFFYHSQTPADTAFAVSVLGAGGRAKIWQYSSSVNMYVE
jgi:Tfp pilus assembly protein FimT